MIKPDKNKENEVRFKKVPLPKIEASTLMELEKEWNVRFTLLDQIPKNHKKRVIRHDAIRKNCKVVGINLD